MQLISMHWHCLEHWMLNVTKQIIIKGIFMTAKIEFFPVGNGDMTLITTESGKKILVDINIRIAADNDSNDTPDVATMLRERLDRDDNDRLFVDVFLLSHPDKDHCTGLTKHFHLGEPDKWKEDDDKILIKEMWSSPIIFRRHPKSELCDDARAWKKEAKRRVRIFEGPDIVDDGDFIQILGEDKGDNTKGLEDILIKTGELITDICDVSSDEYFARLLAPKLVGDDDVDDLKGKNTSSVILRFGIKDDNGEHFYFLTGGDAEVENWERVWSRNKNDSSELEYNLLQAPHHCSWGSLSYETGDNRTEDSKPSENAKSALSQALKGAQIVASSAPIEEGTGKARAKQEYKLILKDVDGMFYCTMEECDNAPFVIEISSNDDDSNDDGGDEGSKLRSHHEQQKPRLTEKRGGGTYA